VFELTTGAVDEHPTDASADAPDVIVDPTFTRLPKASPEYENESARA
jgi:hypothetical protein